MTKDERIALMGNPKYYRYFYSCQQDMEAEAFQKSKGWNKIWASESQGMNGDTWIVYRDVSDLPKHLQDYAKDQMEADARLEAKNNRSRPEAVKPYLEKHEMLEKVKAQIKSGLMAFGYSEGIINNIVNDIVKIDRPGVVLTRERINGKYTGRLTELYVENLEGLWSQMGTGAVQPYIQRKTVQEIDLDDPVHVLGWEND